MRDKINKILKFSGLNKKEFAEKIGVSQVGLNNYINNDRIPTTEVILKIKQSFNEISLDWLFTGEGTMLKNEEKKEISVPATGQNVGLLEVKLANAEEKIQLLQNQIEDKNKIITTLESNQKLLQEKISAYEKSTHYATASQSITRPTL